MCLLVVLAALPLARIYHGGLLTRLLLGAAVAPVVLSALMRRLPAYTVAPLSALALLGYTLFAVRVSAQHADLPGTVWSLWRDAAHNGIPRLLTALIPIEPQPDTVLVPVVATWLAGLAGAELAVRYRRVLFGCAPPTVLYAGALLVVGPNAHPALWQPLAYAAVAAAALAVTGPPAGAATDLSPHDRWALRARLTTSGAAALVVIVGLSVAVGPALAGRVATAPTDPRRYVAPPDLSAEDENPLIRLSGWALNPTEKLFDTDITTTVPASDLRIRLAVMSDYDGVNWLVHGDYREAGQVLPEVGGPDEPSPAGQRPISQRITIDDLDGRLLPAAQNAHEVNGVRVGYDQATGTLIRPTGLSTGMTYTVRSEAPTLNVNLLPGADVPGGPTVARFLRLGVGAPDEMTKLATQLGADVAAPYQRAEAIASFLSDHYTLVTDAPSGHAYPNLNFFLFAARNLGGQRGTSEQFAASFAVLGRMLGLPTRVVVGFTARPGHSTVLGRDALAWPEVLFTGVGWVPFDPLPHPDTTPRPLEDDFQPKPPPSAPPPSAAPTLAVSPSPHAPRPSPSSSAVPLTGGAGPGLYAGIGGGLVAVLVAGFAWVAAARRAQRRRRLDQGPPAVRVAGAWYEVLDALRLAGRPAAAHLAVTEVAAHAATVVAERDRMRRGAAGGRLPAPSLRDLATLANEVTFAAGMVREEDARRAKAQALAYVEELRARRSWWRRLLWSADPRPLRWHRRRPRGAAAGGPVAAGRTGGDAPRPASG
jgi:hypothetical protein